MIYITILLIISGGVGQEGITIRDKQVQDFHDLCKKAILHVWQCSITHSKIRH